MCFFCFVHVLSTFTSECIIFSFLFCLNSHNFVTSYEAVFSTTFNIFVMPLTNATRVVRASSRFKQIFRFWVVPSKYQDKKMSVQTKKNTVKTQNSNTTSNRSEVWTIVVAFVKAITKIYSIRKYIKDWPTYACTKKFSLTAETVLPCRYKGTTGVYRQKMQHQQRQQSSSRAAAEQRQQQPVTKK